MNNIILNEAICRFSMYPGVYHESYWEFPKGALEKGETLVEAAVREFKEEAGITLNQEIETDL